MKVVLIGNMNNMNFSVMRYLRDLGVDAHLVLMKNDISKSQTHFAPDYDTWDIEKWNPYIHYFPHNDWEYILFRSTKKLKKFLLDYDILIGSGYMPALMHKCGLRLDVFYPYATGIEGVGTPEIRNGNAHLPWYQKPIHYILKKLQISGIREARMCINAELSLTKQTFEEIDVDFLEIPVPMLYNKGKNHIDADGDFLNKINNYRFKFLCHSSHMTYKNHRNYILGYTAFVESQKDHDSVLILLEYGRDIKNNKDLISELGINDNVIWLPLMSRKKIQLLLNQVDFGFCEFQNRFWGNTGWEFLASGVPFFHYYDISAADFEAAYGCPMPPFINTNNPDVICEHLVSYTQTPAPYKERGRAMKEWFDKYGGIGLAERWKALIEDIYINKQN